MDIETIGFAPQGWQCPICRRVYSPATPMCWYCGDATGTITAASMTSILHQKTDREIWEEAVDKVLANDNESEVVHKARKELMMGYFDDVMKYREEANSDN